MLIDTDVNPWKYHNTPPPPTTYFFHAQVKGHGQNSLAAVHGRDIEPAKAGVGAGVQIHLVVVVEVVFILVSGREIIVEATEDSFCFFVFQRNLFSLVWMVVYIRVFFFFFEKEDRAPTCSLLVCAFLVSVWCVVCVVIFKNVVETKEKWACLHVVVDIHPSSVVVRGVKKQQQLLILSPQANVMMEGSGMRLLECDCKAIFFLSSRKQRLFCAAAAVLPGLPACRHKWGAPW